MTDRVDELSRSIRGVRRKLPQLRRRALLAMIAGREDVARVLLHRRRSAADELDRLREAVEEGTDPVLLRVAQRVGAVDRLVEATLAELPARAAPGVPGATADSPETDPRVNLEVEALRVRMKRR